MSDKPQKVVNAKEFWLNIPNVPQKTGGFQSIKEHVNNIIAKTPAKK
jgi:hypothetical protein